MRKPGIKSGDIVGNLPLFKADGTPFDWKGRVITGADSADLPLAYFTGDGGPLFVPRLAIVDSSLGIDFSGTEALAARWGVKVAQAAAMPAPQNIDDPIAPWIRALLSGTPQAPDTTARPPEQYIGGRLAVVCKRLGGGPYVETGASYLHIHKDDSRPLCDSLPATPDGATFSGGTEAIDQDNTEAVLKNDRITQDSADLDAVAQRFDRIRIWFVSGPEGETMQVDSAPEPVDCRANNEAATTVHLDGPVTTTTTGDADYNARKLDEAIFAAVTSDIVRYVIETPSAAEIMTFLTEP